MGLVDSTTLVKLSSNLEALSSLLSCRPLFLFCEMVLTGHLISEAVPDPLTNCRCELTCACLVIKADTCRFTVSGVEGLSFFPFLFSLSLLRPSCPLAIPLSPLLLFPSSLCPPSLSSLGPFFKNCETDVVTANISGSLHSGPMIQLMMCIDHDAGNT